MTDRRSPGSTATQDAPGARGRLRAVALPTEHGGWGLTLEPAVLGVLVAPGTAAWCLTAAALLAFVARTPLKVVLVDRFRGRRTSRAALATRLVLVELLALVALVVVAVRAAEAPFWWPALLAAPLVGVELWFDMRSRSRRLAPELAGAVGVSAVAAMITLAGGGTNRLALALWLIPAARVLTSVPFVRAQVARLHDRPVDHRLLVLTDVVALVTAGAAVLVEPQVAAGAIAVCVVVAYQRVSARGAVPRVGVLGARQMVLGFTVVLVTALGVLSPWP